MHILSTEEINKISDPTMGQVGYHYFWQPVLVPSQNVMLQSKLKQPTKGIL